MDAATGDSVWYAAKVRYGQELVVKRRLESLGIEHFIPTSFSKNTRGKVVEKAAINNLVFLRTDKVNALDLVNFKGLPLKYMIDCVTHSMLIVPEKNMSDFMKVFDVSLKEGGLMDTVVVPGQKVRVEKGPLKGVEGNVLELQGETYVVVGLCGCVYANAKVPKAWLSALV